MNLDEFAKLGSALGGIIGPFVVLVSVVFIYFAYKEQIKSNNNMREFQTRQSIYYDIDGIRKMIDDLKYYQVVSDNGKEKIVQYSSRAAIEVFAECFRTADNQDKLLNDVFFHDLYFVVGRFDVVVTRIVNSNINDELKYELFKDISFLYSGKCFKGMTDLLAVDEIDKSLRATIQSTGINLVDHYKMMISFHKRITELILKYQS